MSSNLRISLALLSLIFSTLGFGQQQACTQAEAMRALDEADSLRTWDALYKSYHSYQSCDDGAIAEGYSESVIRILADHWSTLPQLNRLAKQDVQFRRFVIRHVDATLNSDDVVRVARRAKTACPEGLRALCNDLAKQTDGARKEAASP